MGVDHAVLCGRAAIAHAVDGFIRCRTDLPVFSSPVVAHEPGAGCEQLGARVQETIVPVGAAAYRVVDGGKRTIGIDETQGNDQAAECVDSSRCESGL